MHFIKNYIVKFLIIIISTSTSYGMKIKLIQTKQHLNTKITGQLVSNNNFAKVAIMYKVISSLYLIQQSIAPNADDIIVL